MDNGMEENSKKQNKHITKEDFLNQTIETKLSLRKSKLNEIINSGRLKRGLNHSIYEINKDDLKIDDQLKQESKEKVTDKNSYFLFAYKLLSSKKIDELKYGIYLLRNLVLLSSEEPKNTNLAAINGIYNRNFLNDLLDILENNITNFVIVYEILWILINLFFQITNSEILNIMIAPRCYSLWERIFKYNDKELSSMVIWIFCNIAYENKNVCCEIFKAKIFIKNILNIYENSQIAYNEIIKINNLFIEKTIIFFSLVFSQINKELMTNNLEISTKMFKLLLNYSNVKNSELFFYICLGISNCDCNILKDNLDLFYQSDLLYLVISKNFIDIPKIRLFGNRIVGNWLSILEENNFTDEFYNKIFDYFQDNLFYTFPQNDSTLKKDTIWAMSNLLICGGDNFGPFLKRKAIIEYLIKLYNEEISTFLIAEIINIFCIVISYSNLDDFILFMKHKIFSVIMNNILRFQHLENIMTSSFTCILICLNKGEELKEKQIYKVNYFWNLFIELGGEDLCSKFQIDYYYANNTLDKTIAEIVGKYLSKEDRENIIMSE